MHQLQIILVFVLVSLLSRKLGDRWQLLYGLVIGVIGYSWLIGLVGNATKGESAIVCVCAGLKDHSELF